MKTTKKSNNRLAVILGLLVVAETGFIVVLIIALITSRIMSRNMQVDQIIKQSKQVYELTDRIFFKQDGKLNDFQQIIWTYSNSIFECTLPDKSANPIWGVFEEPISKRSNFQEKEIMNGFTNLNGNMIHVYPDMGGIFAIATCPTKGQAQDLAKILVILKGHGSKYGTVFD